MIFANICKGDTYATIKGMSISMATLICNSGDLVGIPMVVNRSLNFPCLLGTFLHDKPPVLQYMGRQLSAVLWR